MAERISTFQVLTAELWHIKFNDNSRNGLLASISYLSTKRQPWLLHKRTMVIFATPAVLLCNCGILLQEKTLESRLSVQERETVSYGGIRYCIACLLCRVVCNSDCCSTKWCFERQLGCCWLLNCLEGLRGLTITMIGEIETGKHPIHTNNSHASPLLRWSENKRII